MRAYLPDFDLRVPQNLTEALNIMANEPGVWKPFAGGTDLMVLLEAGKLAHQKFISLWRLPELSGIEVKDNSITIGALTTYTQIQSDKVLQNEFPMLCKSASWTGGVAIQNRGTLGGNIANASPAADSLPALLVYEADLELISAQGTRTIAYRDFHTGYKTTLMRDDELIKAIKLPRKTKDWLQHSRKVGTRKVQAISKVCLAILADIQDKTIKEIRIAFGSVAPMPIRCPKTEAILNGQKLDAALINAARNELIQELKPIDDIRSTSEYRLRVAANLLTEFLHFEN